MKTNLPTISVIIPIYNVEAFVTQCIQSVIFQTYAKLEIILIDDGSTDGSRVICDQWQKQDKRIKVIHQKNAGLSAARNTGITNATGQCIIFVDSDDWIEPNCIEVLYRDLIANQCDIAMADCYLDYANKTTNSSTRKFYILSPQDCLHKILYSDGINVSACGKLYPKQLFDGITFPIGKKFEDIATAYKPIMRATRIAYRSLPLYHYRKNNPNSITHESFSLSKLDRVNLATKFTQDILKSFPSLSQACQRFMVYSHLSTLAYAGNANSKDTQIIKSLIEPIKKYRKTVLHDKNTPKKDKAALLCTYFGYRFYCFVWKTFYTRRER